MVEAHGTGTQAGDLIELESIRSVFAYQHQRPLHITFAICHLEVALSNKFFTDLGARELVEMNMGLHAATPKIEAFYQHYEDNFNTTRGEQCGSWVDWYGEVVCDLDTLVNLTGAETIITSNQSSTS